MSYSSLCENREIISKLKKLGFPQEGGLTGAYIDNRYQNLIYNHNPSKEDLEYLEYVPLYSEILDWFMEEHGLNLIIRSRNDNDLITWEYEVWLIETGNLVRAGRGIENEINVLKFCIIAALDINPEELKEFIDQYHKNLQVKLELIKNA